MRPIPVSSRLDNLSALIVQESIACCPPWSSLLGRLGPGFVNVHFQGLPDLLECAGHFQRSIAIVEKHMFQRGPVGEGAPPRVRRSLRVVARIDGAEPPAELERLLLLGCYGFVNDRITAPSLARALRAVAAGEISAGRKVLSGAVQRLLAGVAAPKLTNREQEVLSLIGQRLSNKRIAEQLFISGETLRWHLRNLYAKTEMRTRSELLEYARAMGPSNVCELPVRTTPPQRAKAAAVAGWTE